MNLFQEIARANSVLCTSLGLDCDTYTRPLSDVEANGTPLSPEEAEIAVLMAKGINRRGAEMFTALNHMPPSPVVRLPVLGLPYCIVEYARTPAQVTESTRMFGEALDKFYTECRRRTIAPVFVGD